MITTRYVQSPKKPAEQLNNFAEVTQQLQSERELIKAQIELYLQRQEMHPKFRRIS
jgi:hypothetical protein